MSYGRERSSDVCSADVFVKPLLGEIVSVMPETFVEIRPAFTRKLAPPCSTWPPIDPEYPTEDRKSTRLNSSHANTSYAGFCLQEDTSKAIVPAPPNVSF